MSYYIYSMAIPKYDELFNPTIAALKDLGGSGTNEEIEEKVAEILKLSEDEVAEIHRGNRTKLSYRLAWSRNYLKRYGILENSARGVWSLTTVGQHLNEVDPHEVNKTVKSLDKKEKAFPNIDEDQTPEGDLSLDWEQSLLEQMQTVSPNGFERLCQRLLREAGFVEVKVTGKTGDGGIDGVGIIRINLISFRVIFQCKRYKGSVSSQQMREFKGTMTGRAERGLFITTGTFTRDAKLEAARDGSPPIDLVDGERLVSLMKEYKLGVNVSIKEEVEVNREWFLPYAD